MKKNLLSILILVLLVVNIILSTIMMISVTSTNRKTSEFITSVASVLHLELYNPGGVAVTDVSLEDTETYDIAGDLTIPVVNAEGKDSYIIFRLGLLQNTKHKDYKKYGGQENIAARESMILDTVSRVVSSHTLEEFRDDTEGVREEILKAIQELFGSDFIFKITISGVKYSG